VVWVPKYRYRILTGSVRQAAEDGVQAICGYAGCEVVELNVQPDPVHLVLMIPPKVAVSELLGRLKGQTSIKMFHQFRHLKKKPYWGNHFWTKGYCVDTVGLDSDMIRKYVRYQEKKEQQFEQLQLCD
jgi:putative transposase